MADSNNDQCAAKTKAWVDTQRAAQFGIKGKGSTVSDMNTFFLHVPRTAGRTLFSCLIKPAYPPSRRCPPSYDKVMTTNCGLQSSHDDYSLVEEMDEGVNVITQIRDPIDRVLSAYEWTLEHAANVLKLRETHLPTPEENILTERRRLGGKNRKAAKKRQAQTINVWPWSILIPVMEKDLMARADAIEAKGDHIWSRQLDRFGREYWYNSETDDSQWERPKGHENHTVAPYHNDITMPLEEFIKLPEVHELIHNGGVKQLLGLTNYTRKASDNADVRRCLDTSESARQIAVEFAKERLQKMKYFGFMNRLSDSVSLLAHTLKVNLHASFYQANTPDVFQYETNEEMEEIGDGEEIQPFDTNIFSGKHPPGFADTPHEEPKLKDDESYRVNKYLGMQFQRCATTTQTRSKKRKSQLLRYLRDPDGNRVPEFSSALRKEHVTQEIRDYIKGVNDMDVDLSDFALPIFDARLEENKENLHELPDLEKVNRMTGNKRMSEEERQEAIEKKREENREKYEALKERHDMLTSREHPPGSPNAQRYADVPKENTLPDGIKGKMKHPANTLLKKREAADARPDRKMTPEEIRKHNKSIKHAAFEHELGKDGKPIKKYHKRDETEDERHERLSLDKMHKHFTASQKEHAAERKEVHQARKDGKTHPLYDFGEKSGHEEL